MFGGGHRSGSRCGPNLALPPTAAKTAQTAEREARRVSGGLQSALGARPGVAGPVRAAPPSPAARRPAERFRRTGVVCRSGAAALSPQGLGARQPVVDVGRDPRWVQPPFLAPPTHSQPTDWRRREMAAVPIWGARRRAPRAGRGSCVRPPRCAVGPAPRAERPWGHGHRMGNAARSHSPWPGGTPRGSGAACRPVSSG